MSDFITATQETFRNQCIELFAGLHGMAQSLAERARDQRGQTAAEYMGILFIISAIIATIMLSNIDETIKTRLNEIVKAIGNGVKP